MPPVLNRVESISVVDVLVSTLLEVDSQLHDVGVKPIKLE